MWICGNQLEKMQRRFDALINQEEILAQSAFIRKWITNFWLVILAGKFLIYSSISFLYTSRYLFLLLNITRESGIFDLRAAKSSSSKLTKPVISFPGCSKGINSAFFSPSGHCVLETCNDCTLKVFDVQQQTRAKCKNNWLVVLRM